MSELGPRTKTPEEMSIAQFEDFGSSNTAARIALYELGEQKSADRYIWEKILERNVGTKNTIYDIACGNGMPFISLAQGFGYQGKLVGIDWNPLNYWPAQDSARRKGYKNIRYQKGDGTNLIKIEDDVADTSISADWLYLLNSKHKQYQAMREQARITRDYGLAVNCTRGPLNIIEIWEGWWEYCEVNGIEDFPSESIYDNFSDTDANKMLPKIMPDTLLAHWQVERIVINTEERLGAFKFAFNVMDRLSETTRANSAHRQRAFQPFQDRYDKGDYFSVTVQQYVYESIIHK